MEALITVVLFVAPPMLAAGYAFAMSRVRRKSVWADMAILWAFLGWGPSTWVADFALFGRGWEFTGIAAAWAAWSIPTLFAAFKAGRTQ